VAGRRKAAVGAPPHQHRHPLLGQVEGELGGVVAGVEDQQRHWPAGGQACKQRVICAAAVWSVSSKGCSRWASTGAVQASRSKPSRAIHWNAQPATIGWPAGCREGWSE
jgi:hypothetical protein